VRHGLLAGGLGRGTAGRVAGVQAVGPVQVEDGHHAVGVEQLDVVLNGGLVVRAGVGAVDIGLGVPAGLVEGHADGVDAPAGHGGNRRLVAGAVEDPVALDAGVLG